MTNAVVSKQAFRRYIRLQQDREQEESLQVLRSFLPRKPYPTIEGFKAVFAELAEQIPAARNADPKDFIDTKFLEELDRGGYIDGLYR